MKPIAGLLLTLVLLAGCGGDDERLSKQEYQAEVSKIGGTLGSAIQGVDTDTAGGDLTQVQGQVEQMQRSLRAAADDLDELEPPEDVEGSHAKLVQGIRGFADDLDDLDDAIRQQDVAAIREFENDFTNSDAVKQIREAAAELQEQGYTLE